MRQKSSQLLQCRHVHKKVMTGNGNRYNSVFLSTSMHVRGLPCDAFVPWVASWRGNLGCSFVALGNSAVSYCTKMSFSKIELLILSKVTTFFATKVSNWVLGELQKWTCVEEVVCLGTGRGVHRCVVGVLIQGHK
mmetsp:Transcript_32288/g.74183  ORF Transcript_32288/g.74183 Transcript_32288/m.74183 type:complete len:135 (-) Transcript_32288:37-441(-)